MNIYRCQTCSTTLTYNDYIRSPFCEKPNCQRAKVQYYLDEKKEKLRQFITKEVTTACKHYFNHNKNKLTNHKNIVERSNLNNLKTAHVAILPSNSRPLVRLADQNKKQFLSHLKEIYTDIIEQRLPSTKVYASQLMCSLQKDENELLGKACATCKGDCCHLGKNHAFQDMPSLTYLLEHDGRILNLETLTQIYSQYFPETHYKGSCVFQGNLGCTLPRKLRSFTCNNYRCEPLRSYHQLILDSKHSLTLAAATKGNEVHKITVYDIKTSFNVK